MTASAYHAESLLPACQIKMRHFILGQREVEILGIGVGTAVDEQRDGVSLLVDFPERLCVKRRALVRLGRGVRLGEPVTQFRIARIVVDAETEVVAGRGRRIENAVRSEGEMR